jgi:hypothetical protein
MNKKLLIIIVVIAVPIVVIAAISFIFPENTWLSNGITWIKEVNPIAPKPDNIATGRPLDTLITTANDNIKVTAPKPNSVVVPGFIVTGEARVFENQFSWRLTTNSGELLGQGDVTALVPSDADEYGPIEFVPFEFGVMFPAPKESSGILEVFDFAAKDGSEIDKVRIPLKFK